MQNKLYTIRKVSVVLIKVDTYTQKLKNFIRGYKIISAINKPVLILCTGKYSVSTGEKLFNKIYNRTDKNKLRYMKFISYVTENADTINQDINRFLVDVEKQN